MEAVAIVAGEDRFQELGSHVIEQVVGKIADPDVGSRIVGRRHRCGCGVCIRDEPPAPIAVDREERFGIGVRVEGRVEAKPGNGVEIVGLSRAAWVSPRAMQISASSFSASLCAGAVVKHSRRAASAASFCPVL